MMPSPHDLDDGRSETATMVEKQNPSLIHLNAGKLSVRKKLTLTPELKRRIPFGSIKTPSFNRPISFNGFKFLKNNAIELEENMELVSKSILVERKNFQNYVDSLHDQVVQLEEENYLKTVKIENLQLYNSNKLKIINSLITVLNETKWKNDTTLRICKENVPNKSYKNMLLVTGILDQISAFKSNQEDLYLCLKDIEERSSLAQVVFQLKSCIDDCISIIDNATDRELSDEDFNDTIKTVVDEIRNFQLDLLQRNCNSTVGIGDLLKITRKGDHNIKNLIELWEILKDLFQNNQYLTNRVISLNVHKNGLQLELDEMKNNAKELELKTISEIKKVEKKQEILNQNESLIQQHWDEMDTSQEIVIQTHRAQEIDQELEDLRVEYHSHDIENRQLKKDLSHLKNELAEYQLKCEQLEQQNKQMEDDKNEILEAYAKSWGHYNEKQKIKYTGRLIKDIDSMTQEIKLYELEVEKIERSIVNSTVRTPVFNKTQTKSEKIPRVFGVIDANRRQTTSLFRESVISQLRY